MNNNNNTYRVTQKRLRDLATRALQVTERYKDHVGVAAAAQTVAPASNRYIAAYDDAVRYREGQANRMQEGRKSLNELERQVRMGLAIVYAARCSFDARELEGTVDTPDRLISDARKLLAVLSETGTLAAGKVSEALEQAIEQADVQWAKAREARLDLQQRQAELRELALVLNRELVALRRILRATVGTSNHAYQLLRTSRVITPEGDETEQEVVEEGDHEKTSAPQLIPNSTSNGASKGASNLAGNSGLF